MQERQVTAAGQQHSLELPFFVLATQNPIEQEGTYPLPEAQLDRFMFNIVLDYPSYEEELQVVKTTTTDNPASVHKIIGAKEIIAYQHLIRRMPIADNVVEYAVKLASSTRPNTAKAAKIVNEFVAWGAGPRASQSLVLAAKGHAAINGKYSPDMEDVQAVALPILRHRIIKNFKAEAEGVGIEKIIEELL
jgi:MoxR-like ATPase